MFRVLGTLSRNEERERHGTASQNGMERRSDAAGTCASALGRPPLPLPARRLPPPSSAAAQLRARTWGAGRNRAVVVLLATAQREALLALAHGLLDASTLRLSGSALPARQRPPWSPTRTRRSVLLRGPDGGRVKKRIWFSVCDS